MTISVIKNQSLKYPSLNEGSFSPDKKFPEYFLNDYSKSKNFVYESVRKVFAQAGLDKENLNHVSWNPLKDFIKPGDKVFILCNFVTHKRKSENENEFFSKVTHPSVIRAVCDYILVALKGQGEVMIGNSPLQSADFEEIKKSLSLNKIEEFYRNKTNVKVQFVDLRGYVTKLEHSGKLTVLKNEIDSVGMNIDFSDFSSLNGVTGNKKFRITNYSYKNIANLHKGSKHIYCINKEIMTSDVVFSLPKLKVHEKVGVTLGVKGFVGTVASKESLCHHQFGSPCIGGDEYPDCNPFKIIYSFLHDFTYSFKIPILTSLFQVIDRNLTRIFNRIGNKITAGAWFGNDTAWRMSVDLAKIIHFVDKNGVLHDKCIRKNLLLIDGVIGGEGQGPLKPKPVESQTLIFSDNIVKGDYTASLTMGYMPRNFKIISEFFNDSSKLKIVDDEPLNFIFNGKILDEDTFSKSFIYRYLSPIGWRKHLKRQ